MKNSVKKQRFPIKKNRKKVRFPILSLKIGIVGIVDLDGCIFLFTDFACAAQRLYAQNY